MAISNVPWFATTVEGPFDVGTGGIFATVVRVVQAFVCVWVIILVNVKFILPEETGRQYSDQSVNKTDILRKEISVLLTWQEYWSHYEPYYFCPE